MSVFQNSQYAATVIKYYILDLNMKFKLEMVRENNQITNYMYCNNLKKHLKFCVKIIICMKMYCLMLKI